MTDEHVITGDWIITGGIRGPIKSSGDHDSKCNDIHQVIYNLSVISSSQSSVCVCEYQVVSGKVSGLPGLARTNIGPVMVI